MGSVSTGGGKKSLAKISRNRVAKNPLGTACCVPGILEYPSVWIFTCLWGVFLGFRLLSSRMQLSRGILVACRRPKEKTPPC